MVKIIPIMLTIQNPKKKLQSEHSSFPKRDHERTRSLWRQFSAVFRGSWLGSLACCEPLVLCAVAPGLYRGEPRIRKSGAQIVSIRGKREKETARFDHPQQRRSDNALFRNQNFGEEVWGNAKSWMCRFVRTIM